MLRPTLSALCVATAFALPAAAQSVIDCGGWQASARNLVEPWEANTRTFANGKVRVSLLDTVEPAAGAFYLMVIAPPYDELGSRTCGLVAEGDGSMGFAGLNFQALQASYDPASGLTIGMPANRYNTATAGFDPSWLSVTINQAAGTITIRAD